MLRRADLFHRWVEFCESEPLLLKGFVAYEHTGYSSVSERTNVKCFAKKPCFYANAVHRNPAQKEVNEMDLLIIYYAYKQLRHVFGLKAFSANRLGSKRASASNGVSRKCAAISRIFS